MELYKHANLLAFVFSLFPLSQCVLHIFARPELYLSSASLGIIGAPYVGLWLFLVIFFLDSCAYITFFSKGMNLLAEFGWMMRTLDRLLMLKQNMTTVDQWICLLAMFRGPCWNKEPHQPDKNWLVCVCLFLIINLWTLLRDIIIVISVVIYHLQGYTSFKSASTLFCYPFLCLYNTCQDLSWGRIFSNSGWNCRAHLADP